MGEIQAFHHLIESAPVFVIGHIGSLLAVFVIEQIFSVRRISPFNERANQGMDGDNTVFPASVFIPPFMVISIPFASLRHKTL